MAYYDVKICDRDRKRSSARHNHKLWSDEEDRTLIKMWNCGFTTYAISREVRRTRNSVVGRVHRLKNLGLIEQRGLTPKKKQKNKVLGMAGLTKNSYKY